MFVLLRSYRSDIASTKFFWAGMAITSGAGACLGWIRKRLDAQSQIDDPLHFSKVCSEIPREQFFYSVDGVLGDSRKDVSQITFGIDPVQLGCSDQAVKQLSLTLNRKGID